MDTRLQYWGWPDGTRQTVPQTVHHTAPSDAASFGSVSSTSTVTSEYDIYQARSPFEGAYTGATVGEDTARYHTASVLPLSPTNMVVNGSPLWDHSRRDSSETYQALDRPQTSSKRRAQNRAAQRAFRERKEKHTRELEQQCAIKDAKYRELQKHDEARYRGLEKAHEAERREFEQKYAELEQRNETLEQLLLMTNEGRTCDPKALCEIVQGKARGRKMTIISKADRK